MINNRPESTVKVTILHLAETAVISDSESVVDPEGPEPEQQGSTKTKEVEAHS